MCRLDVRIQRILDCGAQDVLNANGVCCFAVFVFEESQFCE